MDLAMNKFNLWRYLQGDFFYGVHWVRLRKAVKILIAIVLGGLLLAGLYALFGDVVMRTLKTKIQEMFNYKG